ncbi:MAG: hypothetical protein HYU34_04065 [Candidatus Omnitrophica bacterium]|nr:hypothetical protein [Candidatus Omnitrophota bacterium]
MVFHLGFELPSPAPAQPLDPDTDRFTRQEMAILKHQIRKNTGVIDTYIRRIDLFVNQEKYPQREAFIQKIRRRMFLLMEENDTFRQVLCRHLALSLE